MDEMLEALGRLIADRDLRDQIGKSAREHVTPFDWDVVAAKWQAAYLDIAKGKYHGTTKSLSS